MSQSWTMWNDATWDHQWHMWDQAPLSEPYREKTRNPNHRITEFVLQDVIPSWTSLSITDTNASRGARHHSAPTETVFGHLSRFWGLTRCVPSFPLTLVWGRNRDIGITGGGFWLSPRGITEQPWAFIVRNFSSFFFFLPSYGANCGKAASRLPLQYKWHSLCPSSPKPSCALSIALSCNEECQRGIEFFSLILFFKQSPPPPLLSSTPPLLHPPTHPHPVHLPSSYSHTTPPLYQYPTLSTQTHDKLPCQQNSFRDQLIPQKWTRSHQLLKNSKCRERGS